MRYYFCAWMYLSGNHAAMVGGNQVLGYTHEFDLGEAHEYLDSLHGEPVLILSWQEVSERAANRYQAYVRRVTAAREREARRGLKPALELRPGGKGDGNEPA